MPPPSSTPNPRLPAVPLGLAADLQDDLLAVTNDLERLQTLLDHSHEAMQAGFFGLLGLLRDPADAARTTPQRMDEAQQHMAGAVKALQFQDMATQLIDHTSRRLRHCADRLAEATFGSDADGPAVVEAAPLRPNPVTQSEMDTGFIELF